MADGTVSTGGPAKDDTYSFVEDSAALASIYDALNRILTLDLIANDGGNSGTILYAVDDGNGNLSAADQQLAGSDVGGTWEKTALGNWIRIINGKVQYKLADPAHANDFNYARDVNSLGAGVVINDQF